LPTPSFFPSKFRVENYGSDLPLFVCNILLTGINGQNGALPPPPWEAQSGQSNQLAGQDFPAADQSGQFGGIQPQPLQSAQCAGTYPVLIQNGNVGGMYPQPMQGGQFLGMVQQQQAMYAGQMMGYVYGQQPNAQFNDQRAQSYPYGSSDELSQRVYGLSMQDNITYMSKGPSYTHVPSSTSYLQQSKNPPKPEDKLFGDLVSMAKTKPSKAGTNKVGST